MTIREKCTDLYYAIFGDKAAQMDSFKYAREVTLLVCLSLIGVGGWYGYKTYRLYQEKAAQKVFGECLQEYEKAMADKSLLPNAELVFKVGYEQHKSSNLAPYFLAYRADILAKQNKKSEAIEIMNDMLNVMPKSSPLYASYTIKRALMRMDMDDAAVQEAGLTELQTIAQDAKSSNRDEALYYVGLFHWSKSDLSKAKEAWSTLVALQKDDRTHQSPWAVVVQEKLQQIA